MNQWGIKQVEWQTIGKHNKYNQTQQWNRVALFFGTVTKYRESQPEGGNTLAQSGFSVFCQWISALLFLPVISQTPWWGLHNVAKYWAHGTEKTKTASDRTRQDTVFRGETWEYTHLQSDHLESWGRRKTRMSSSGATQISFQKQIKVPFKGMPWRHFPQYCAQLRLPQKL